MTRRRLAGLLLCAVAALVWPQSAAAQRSTSVARVGVIHPGGEWDAIVKGLRRGLRDLGLEEGKHFSLDIQQVSGDQQAAAKAAADLEGKKVTLIFTFFAGADVVASGLVASLARPGGRLTGVHGLTRDLTPKRLELLKELVPRARRVMTFYDPGNAMSMDTLTLARRTAEQLGLQLVERHVGSVEALRLALQSWKPAEADAYFQVSDPRLTSQAGLIIDAALANRVPTMFHTSNLAERGGLASYGQDFRQSGRAAAKHVQRTSSTSAPLAPLASPFRSRSVSAPIA